MDKLSLFSALPGGISRVQIDVVDGRFVAPAYWPYLDVPGFEKMVAEREMLPQLERISYEIDLMCVDAEFSAGAWLALGASRLTFHAEAAPDLARLLAATRRRYGGDPTFAVDSLIFYGLAINLDTPLTFIEPYLSQISYVQFMGTERIGKQGQPFDRRVIERTRAFHAKYPDLPMQVDGGVSQENAHALFVAGATDIIVGSAILKAENPIAAFVELAAFESSYCA